MNNPRNVKPEELARQIVDLSAQQLVLREAVALLLARSIGPETNCEELVRTFSEFIDARIDESTGGGDVTDLRISEIMRREKDWLVAAARLILPGAN